MKTIDERARDYALGKVGATWRYGGYVKGALEQQDIAKKAICSTCVTLRHSDGKLCGGDCEFMQLFKSETEGETL